MKSEDILDSNNEHANGEAIDVNAAHEQASGLYIRGDTINMRKIELIEYDSSWSERFEAEKEILQVALKEVVITVHHIGSTAVPELVAKPIIDILVEVTDLKALDAHNSNMEAIGYKPKGEFGISGRRYFQKGGDERTHQVHAFVSGDINVLRHIAFRDYLRSNPTIAAEYGDLKKRIAETCNNDIVKYCDGKDNFVKHHEGIALKQGASNISINRPA